MPGRRRVTPAWDDGVAATGADPIGTGEPFARAMSEAGTKADVSMVLSNLSFRQ